MSRLAEFEAERPRRLMWWRRGCSFSIRLSTWTTRRGGTRRQLFLGASLPKFTAISARRRREGRLKGKDLSCEMPSTKHQRSLPVFFSCSTWPLQGPEGREDSPPPFDGVFEERQGRRASLKESQGDSSPLRGRISLLASNTRYHHHRR